MPYNEYKAIIHSLIEKSFRIHNDRHIQDFFLSFPFEKNSPTIDLAQHHILMSLPPNASQRLALTEETRYVFTSCIGSQKICISHVKK